MGEYNSDEAFAFFNIIEIFSKVDDFRDWLRTFHGIQDHNEFFEGYRFMMTTCLRCLVGAELLDDPFKLRSDEIFYRVESTGIPFDDAPNTCEKGIFLKQIWEVDKQIQKTRNFESLNNSESLKDLLEMYSKINSLYLTSTSKEFSKEKSLNYVSQFYSYLMLIDTRSGFPHGLKIGIIDSNTNHNFMVKVFQGYLFSLQFLWWKLLGNIEFKKSILSKLHECTKIKFENIDEGIDITEAFGGEVIELPLTKKEKREKIKRHQSLELWHSIDQFFEPVREQIIRPLEKEAGHGLGSVGMGLLQLRNFRKATLRKFLSKKLSEPSWVRKKDVKSRIKQLDCIFRWYYITPLQIEQSYEYNGAYAFIFTLRGYIKTLQKNEHTDGITVLEIKHPAEGTSGYDYSYAVLIGVSGIMSDSSGWLVFYDVATNYSGAGGHLLKQCKEAIDEEKNNIDLRTITVEHSIFRKFLKEKNITIPKIPDVAELYNSSKILTSKIKAKLFEYVTYKWLLASGKYQQVDCDKQINEKQIDCYSIHNDAVEIFECKLNLHDDYKTIPSDLNKKKNAMQKMYPQHKMKLNLVVLKPVYDERKKEFKKSQIKVYDNFQSIIQREDSFKGSRREILKILNSDLKSKYEYNLYDE